MLDNRLPSNWQRVIVEEIKAPEKGSLVSGPFGSNISKKFFVKEGIPVIRGKNLTLGQKKYIDDGYVFITKEKAYELRNCTALPEDLIFTAAGTLGQVGIIPIYPKYPKYIISNKQLRLRCDKTKAIPGYLYYWFSSPYMREYIANQNTGSSIPLITLGTLRNLPINLPPLTTQRKIATILSAYDDLIENNTRRIKILEEMAQAIYREWFMEFRFPGHENVRMIDSGTELGEGPEGWNMTMLGEVCNVVMGQSPESKFYNEIGDGLPFHQGVTDYGDRFPIDRVYCTVQNRLAERGDILFSVRAPVGRLNITNKRIVIGRGLCAIRNRLNNQVFTYQQLKEKFQKEDTMGGGTIFKSVTKSDMLGIRFLLPSKAIIEQFEKIANTIFVLLENLTTKNEILLKTRDLLLPKLVSGELEVRGDETINE